MKVILVIQDLTKTTLISRSWLVPVTGLTGSEIEGVLSRRSTPRSTRRKNQRADNPTLCD